jgi:hypothetical protein
MRANVSSSGEFQISDFSTAIIHLGQSPGSRASWATLWGRNWECRSIFRLQTIPKMIALGGGSRCEVHHVEDAAFSSIKMMMSHGRDVVIFVTWQRSETKNHTQQTGTRNGGDSGGQTPNHALHRTALRAQ